MTPCDLSPQITCGLNVERSLPKEGFSFLSCFKRKLCRFSTSLASSQCGHSICKWTMPNLPPCCQLPEPPRHPADLYRLWFLPFQLQTAPLHFFVHARSTNCSSNNNSRVGKKPSLASERGAPSAGNTEGSQPSFICIQRPQTQNWLKTFPFIWTILKDLKRWNHPVLNQGICRNLEGKFNTF